jgi:predicted Zn-dependent peptidase
VNDAFGVDVVFETSYAHGLMFAETSDVNTLRHAVQDILETAREEGISEEAFTHVKRKMIGHHISLFDKLESLASEINDYLQFNLYFHDLPSMLESIELSEINEALKSIDADTIAFYGGLPKGTK